MNESCSIVSDGETLSVVALETGDDKNTIIYVLPFDDPVFETQSNEQSCVDSKPLFVDVVESSSSASTSSLKFQTSFENELLPEGTVVIVDEAKVEQQKEEHQRERVRLATQAFNSCNERRRRRKKPSKDLTLNPDVEDDNDEDDNTEEGLFSCPICEAVFSRSNAFYGHLSTHSGKGTIFECSECSRQFESLARLWKHEKIHLDFQRSRPFSCIHCHQTFERQSQLNYHIQRIHESKKPFSCQSCSKSFHKNSDLKQHVKVHEGVKNHSCQECGKNFNHVSNLNRHARTHSNEKPYVCIECHKRFSQLSALNAHLTLHNDAASDVGKRRSKSVSIECPDCKRVFKSEGVFKAHMQSDHMRHLPSSKSFHCQICGQKFPFVSELKHHLLRHEDDKQFCCKACGKNFEAADQLLKHSCRKMGKTEDQHRVNQQDGADLAAEQATVSTLIDDFVDRVSMEVTFDASFVQLQEVENLVTQTQFPKKEANPTDESQAFQEAQVPVNPVENLAGKSKFSCEICQKVFARKDCLVQHMGIHDEDFAVWRCDACDQKFAWKSSLKKHKLKVHQNESWPSIPCDLCTRTFRTINHKKTHFQRDHLKIRDFACDSCHKTFFLKSDLTSHQLIHAPERPYSCSMCQKSFKHVSHKIRHELMHKDSKPFSCELCRLKFSKEAAMTQHFKKIHPEMDIRHLQTILSC